MKFNFPAWLRLVRTHQWPKNLLIYTGLFFSQPSNFDSVISVSWVFFCFILASSAVYILNDLLDAENDKLSLRTRFRPLVTGEIRRKHASAVAIILATTTLLAATQVDHSVQAFIGSYFLLNFFYSIRLKRVKWLDLLLLSSFYCVRVLSGVVAVGEVPSAWLCCFSACIFFSLGTLKRYAEVDIGTANDPVVPGRPYGPCDRKHLALTSLVSGVTALSILLTYASIGLHEQHFTGSYWIWVFISAFAAWLLNLWAFLLIRKPAIDPYSFAAKNPISLALTFVGLACLYLAWTEISFFGGR